MFQEWGFLISEMLLLIILAALLGLLVGWIIWGRLRSRDAGVIAGLTLIASVAIHGRVAEELA